MYLYLYLYSGWDVLLFKESIEKKYGSAVCVRCIDPSELTMTMSTDSTDPPGTTDSTSMCVIADSIGPIDHFILEIDQNCLCNEMDREILLHILKYRTHMNDIRTILLVHDKRLLAVLTDGSIMRDYVCGRDVELLQKYIIKTYVLGECPGVVSEALLRLPSHNTGGSGGSVEDRSGWLLKPRGGGKGVGILFGKDCCLSPGSGTDTTDIDRKAWDDVVGDNPSGSGSYVIQPHVSQSHFHVLAATKTNTNTNAET